MTDTYSFKYYLEWGNNYYGEEKQSSDLATSIIKWFLLGYGYNLPADAMMKERVNQNEKEDSKKMFREKIKE